jgi:DNA-binding SARP family transcriptional activator
MAEEIRVHLLGEFQVYRHGVLVTSPEWHTRQAKQLFKLLLRERERVVPAHKLIDLLWPEHTENGSKTLRSAVNALRSVLEPERPPQAPSRWIPRGEAGYKFISPASGSLWLDVVEFEQALETALLLGNTPEGRQKLETALALYTGDYLAEDEAESWAWPERERLRERYLSGATCLAEWQTLSGLYREAIASSRQALLRVPYGEPLYRWIMRCQMSLGDTAGALQTFDQCRQQLDHQLGADPSPQTMELHAAILKGEFQPRFSTAQPRPAEPVSKIEASEVRSEPIFVGRRAELNWLEQQLDELLGGPQAGRNRVAALVGEAGVGKSFLLELFFARVQATPARLMATTCQAIEQKVAFASLVTLLSAWLRETGDAELEKLPRGVLAQVAPLLPQLAYRRPDLPALPSVNSEQAFSAMIGGLVDLFAALSQARPLVLCWDDLQWADEASLLVINRLAALRNLPLFLLVVYRPEDLSENDSLANLLRYLSRDNRCHTLNLGQFSYEEVAHYLKIQRLDAALPVDKLYQATGGNALFLAEAVRILQEQKERQARQPDLIFGASALPGEPALDFVSGSQQIRDVVLARVARLPQMAVDLLEVAAVIEHPFSLDLLRPELSEADYKALELLLARRFLVEVPSVGDQEIQLTFSHNTIARIIYANCSSLKLAQIHLQVASNLVRRYAPNIGIRATEIAHHFRKAGPQYSLQVLRYEVEAGDYARQTFSYQQALAHYAAALQLAEKLPPDLPKNCKAEIQEWRGLAYYGQGLIYEAVLDWQGVQESYQYLWQWAEANSKLTLAASSACRIVFTRWLMGYQPEAAQMGQTFIRHFERKLEDWPVANERGLSLVLKIMQRWASLVTPANYLTPELDTENISGHNSLPLYFLPPPPAAEDWAETIQLLSVSQAATMLTEHGRALLLQGLNSEAEACLKAALKASEESAQVVSWVLAAMNLSRVYHLSGQLEASDYWLEQCIGHSHHLSEMDWAVTWPLLHQAYTLVVEGQLDQAEQILQRLDTQLTRQDNFLAHRYSVQIGFGLLALSRRDVARAERLLCQALAHPASIYIEAYILAELAMANIARIKHRPVEAYRRLVKLLALCGQKSLLSYYCTVALALGQLQLDAELLEIDRDKLVDQFTTISELVYKAGYTAQYGQCRRMLAQLQYHSSPPASLVLGSQNF